MRTLIGLLFVALVLVIPAGGCTKDPPKVTAPAKTEPPTKADPKGAPFQ